MTEQEVLRELGKVGAVISNSHIVYASGKHGSVYINKDAVYPHTALTSRLCKAMAERAIAQYVEAVIAPAVGGVILSQWVAYHLSNIWNGQIPGVYADKVGEHEFVIRRGYDKLIKSRRVLVVEDVLTTGGSVKKVVEAVRVVGGVVVGVSALCNRGDVTAEDVGNVPKLTALVNLMLEMWDESDCPLCKHGTPINTDVGKGRDFLARKQGKI